MLFMVIETFAPGRQEEIYRRVREEGRGFPDGLRYVGSWIDASFARCWQLMESDDAATLVEWIAQAGDLCRFEVVPVVESARVQEVMSRLAARSVDGVSDVD